MEKRANHRPANHLKDATSPYLLQHAHNPVDWYPWGPPALERARREDKPILLSIGYAACHWCHVMERESFENDVIARVMNDDFVCIKVDREERPDLDSIYMAATLAMNQGRGGWPMTVFLTPDGRPFFAGTYFPPEDRHGMPGFPRLLQHLATLWKNERAQLLGHAEELTAMLRDVPPPQSMQVTARAWGRALAHFENEFDSVYGGFGPAPKFPHGTTLQLLLRRVAEHDDGVARTMVVKTLEGMAQGGMIDHIGGGFARYSVDAQWLVPHFEKMLYDNASLAQVYAEAAVITGERAFADVARDTLDFVAREMTDKEGGFYTSYDADSVDPATGHSEEGAYYVWTPAEVAAVLGDDEARRVCAYFDITAEGNFEGRSIPNTPQPMAFVARKLGIAPEELAASVRAAKPKLLAARGKRPAPGLDDKILTAWNGLMISAFAVGARLLGEPKYLNAARDAADFVWRTLRRADGTLLRTCRQGRAHLDAYLEDYAYLALGFVDLYESGGGPVWLSRAAELAEHVLTDFIDPDTGAFFDTAAQHESLLFRVREGHDGATPNANASAAFALGRLSLHLDRPAWQKAALRALEAHGNTMERAPWAFCQALLAWEVVAGSSTQGVFVGTFADASYQALWRAAQATWVPRAVWVHHDPANAAPPLAHGKQSVQGKATLYVCREQTCSAPVQDPAAVRSMFVALNAK